jgi:hypothetical protein
MSSSETARSTAGGLKPLTTLLVRAHGVQADGNKQSAPLDRVGNAGRIGLDRAQPASDWRWRFLENRRYQEW